ncbi:MAG: Hsp20/alpha crystallin family protein [Deltaproteobacteria bacterium]|nr:Hsp20/alpha crystallin family protein [Deltaproteobacteria bacterium]
MNDRSLGYRFEGLAREQGSESDSFVARVSGTLAWPGGRPTADLYESRDALFVKVEIAGMDEEQLRVELREGDTLVVEGERPWRKPEGVIRFHAVEIPYGRFHVEIAVPSRLDRDRLEASYDQGILLVRLPKTAPSQGG